MSTIRRVAVAGATGNLGPPVVRELQAAGFEVTALSRSASSAKLPPGVQVVQVDYESKNSLVSALTGQDVVVSALSFPQLALQNNLVDASIKAGVRRFVPAEFGSDTNNQKAAALPIFAPKTKATGYLKAFAEKGLIEYTSIETGPFLDWCTQVGLFVNFKDKSMDIFDGGKTRFSTTTLDAVGKAVAMSLKHSEQTKNRVVKVHSAVLTQNQILEYAQSAAPGHWTVNQLDSKQMERDSLAALEKGEYGMPVMMGFLKRIIWGEGFGNVLEPSDNELLGIPTLTDDQVKAVIQQYA